MPNNCEARSFTWDSLPLDRPMENLTRRRVIGEKAMISHVTLEKGCFVPTHAHENEQFVCVLEGCLRFRLGPQESQNRREVVITSGDILHLPALVPHEATAVEHSVVLDIFSPPSQTTGIDRVTPPPTPARSANALI